MKKGIHPEYYPEARVVCGCGNSFTTGATKPLIKTDICSACHPFFTGEQRIVDTAGQVERYMRRLERREELGKAIASSGETVEDLGAEGSQAEKGTKAPSGRAPKRGKGKRKEGSK
jgi:large subunit ribosomal protein L31